MWLIALTLNNSLHEIYTKLNRSLENFNYKDSAMVEVLKNTLRKLEFRGVTVGMYISIDRIEILIPISWWPF